MEAFGGARHMISLPVSSEGVIVLFLVSVIKVTTAGVTGDLHSEQVLDCDEN